MKECYRLSANQKSDIAENLVDIIEKDAKPSPDTLVFIGNWVRTIRSEKSKAYYDVWDLVLKNFMPKNRPILIRSIHRKSKSEYIASFTNSSRCAERFSRSFSKKIAYDLGNGETIEIDGNGTGYWIICDTNQTIEIFKNSYKKGEYKYTFYPLSEVFRKARRNGGWGLSDRLLEDAIGEDEYIMKIDYSLMNLLKFIE